jgi:hypothetical protein
LARCPFHILKLGGSVLFKAFVGADFPALIPLETRMSNVSPCSGSHTRKFANFGDFCCGIFVIVDKNRKFTGKLILVSTG